MDFEQPPAERDVQLRRGSATAATAAATTAASAASSGDADVPGRFGDPGNGRVPTAAAAATACAGARTGQLNLAT